MRKELIWIVFCWVITILIYFGIVGLENCGIYDKTHSIILDTGFDTPNWYILVSLLSLVFFITYIIRIVKAKFRNINSNIVLIITNSLFILFITTDVMKINWINEISKIPEDLQLLWQLVFFGALITQFILIITLIIVAVNTGLRYNEKR